MVFLEMQYVQMGMVLQIQSHLLVALKPHLEVGGIENFTPQL